jgi:hypothetical protein
MATDNKMRPKESAAKRKGNHRPVRERRDVDIMNVRVPASHNEVVLSQPSLD